MKMLVKKNAVLRKGISMMRQCPRLVRRLGTADRQYRLYPPVIANSFPKSGTHLLVQILEAMPQATNYGSFWASTPSITFRERTIGATVAMIKRVAWGEVVSAHLFHAKEFAEALRQRRCVHFFIYRDPRDVVVSEAHYLARMNRWHRMHRFFKALATDEERILLSITGKEGRAIPYDYPNVEARFQRYAPWLESSDVCAVRYEDLMSERRAEIVLTMVQFYCRHAEAPSSAGEVVARALANIDPRKSHTFRRGEAGGWRKAFTPGLVAEMKRVAGPLLVKLGYERDLNW